MPNGQYSQLVSLIKNLLRTLFCTRNGWCKNKERESAGSHLIFFVAHGGNRYAKIGGQLDIPGHFTDTDLHDGHVMDGMLYIISKLAQVVGLDGDALFAVGLVAHLQLQGFVLRVVDDKVPDLAYGMKGNVFVVLHRLIVNALIVIHYAQFMALLQANEKLERVAKVLAYGGFAQRLGRFAKIFFTDFLNNLCQLIEYRHSCLSELIHSNEIVIKVSRCKDKGNPCLLYDERTACGFIGRFSSSFGQLSLLAVPHFYSRS